MLGEGLVGQRVQPPVTGIPLDLGVPLSRIEFREPAAEVGQFLRGQAANLVLELLDLCHTSNIA